MSNVALAHGVTLRIVFKQGKNGVRYRAWILKWDDYSPALCKQFFGVPIRSGYNRFSCSKSDRERSGNHLRLMPVRRDVDVRRANMLNKFFVIHEAIV